MKRYLKIVLYGFLLWLIPFAVSVLIFPLRVSQRPLFESIMPVVIAIWTVFFSIIYLTSKNLACDRSGFFIEGVKIGLVWSVMSTALDLVVFTFGPLRMPLFDYLADIAVTYLMMPAITSGMGYLLSRPSSPEESG